MSARPRSTMSISGTATSEIYTLSLHDALPIYAAGLGEELARTLDRARIIVRGPKARGAVRARSEEHTSELQSHVNLVCRLLLEKKKNQWHRHDAMENDGDRQRRPHRWGRQHQP